MKLRGKNDKGITLIALVVTIIVISILTAVTVSQVIGEKGLINKVKTERKDKQNLIKDNENKITAIENELLLEYDEHVEVPLVPPVDPYPETGATIKPGEIAIDGNKNYISNGKTAIIPEGFAVSGIEGENTIDNGLVIYDTNGKTLTPEEWNAKEEGGEYVVRKTYNQFVWIPVENEAKYVRNFTYPCWYGNYGGKLESTPADSTFTDTGYLPVGIQPLEDSAKTNEEAERAAVVASKGFYIGRYEASGTDSIVTCKKGAEVKVNITQENCKILSKTMYNDEHKASALCSGLQWDATMATINNRLDNQGVIYDVKVAEGGRHGGEDLSGNNHWDKVYNIYDLEGNEFEYIAEKVNDNAPCVMRGGFFDGDNPASRRSSSYGNEYIYGSFRTVLYVEHN